MLPPALGHSLNAGKQSLQTELFHKGYDNTIAQEYLANQKEAPLKLN
jgi:hypothetical protein